MIGPTSTPGDFNIKQTNKTPKQKTKTKQNTHTLDHLKLSTGVKIHHLFLGGTA